MGAAPALVSLVCWDPAVEPDRAALLEKGGFTLNRHDVMPGSKLITHIRLTQPAAVVIDLDKLPSHGREVATALRNTKSTRMIPIVLLGGEPEKVERMRTFLPDAFYGAWKQALALVTRAVKQGPAKAAGKLAVPVAMMDRGSGRPVLEKLGVKAGMKLAVMAAPESFVALLNGIPYVSRPGKNTQLTVCFIRSRLELEREMEFLALYPPLWIAFPKQSGALRADFNENDVRELGLATGLVDNKICRIDDDWSGIRFAARRAPAAAKRA